MDILTQKKIERIITPIYQDRYSLTYSFDNTLHRNPKMDAIWSYNNNPFSLVRATPSYDSTGAEVAINTPVYGDFGLRITEGVTNLFSASNSIAFANPETITLEATTYTVSINGGSGKLVLSGATAGECLANNTLTFTLASGGDVVFTPTDGTPELSQIEKRGFRTYWQKGGVEREGDSPRLTLRKSYPSEFGIGICVKFLNDSGGAYSTANGRYLFSSRLNVSNYLDMSHRSLESRLQVDYVIGGVTYNVYVRGSSYSAGDVQGAYLHVVENEGMYLHVYKDGNVRISELLSPTFPTPPSNMLGFGVGNLYRPDQGEAYKSREWTSGEFANLRIDFAPDNTPNPTSYFEEVFA